MNDGSYDFVDKLGAMVRLLVAFALVIATVQCASACVPAVPCCPHHKQAPANCTHELAQATVAQPSVVQLAISSEAVHISFAPGTFVSVDEAAALDPSPPGLIVPFAHVLRI